MRSELDTRQRHQEGAKRLAVFGMTGWTERTARGPSTGVDSANCDAAKAVLLAFFAEMIRWERQMRRTRVLDAQKSSDQTKALAECKTIFDKHCVPKPRLGGRPSHLNPRLPRASRERRETRVRGSLLIMAQACGIGTGTSLFL